MAKEKQVYTGTGRRKTSVARVTLTKGTTIIQPDTIVSNELSSLRANFNFGDDVYNVLIIVPFHILTTYTIIQP